MESVIDERFELDDLLDLGVLREVCESYSSTFDLGISIINNDRKEMVAICPEKKFCKAIKEGGLSDKCTEVINRLARHPSEGQKVIQMKIHCGLRYALFPLSYQFDDLGRVIVGPYRDAASTPDQIMRLLDPKVDSGITPGLIEQIPPFQQDRLKATIGLLATIINAFLFINAKRLITTKLHLETIYNSRDEIFKQVELQKTGSKEDKEEIEKLKNMF